ncbi:MAG: SpoIID/LytB domain-containing protein [Eubacterium sp.]|nr:SpoIID/LytB domain-containing protein [Eubacterium sp.]
MKYDMKLLTKIALIFFGLLFLICIWLGRREQGIHPPDGIKITCQDVTVLLNALDIEPPDEIKAVDAESCLTYEQYRAIYLQMDGEALGIPDYAQKYKTDFEILREDWYDAYRVMLAHLDTESSIWETEIFLLKVDEENRQVYTENGAMQTPYRYGTPEVEENIFRKVKAYVKGNELLTVVESSDDEYELANVWVMESEEGRLECFYRQIVFRTETGERVQQVERESIADLTFRDGGIVKAVEKNQKVHGRLLRVSDTELELENGGIYPLAEDMEIYKLYGNMETLRRTDLKIGYEDSDYVIERGKVCACLVSDDEAADRIRVLLKNTAKNSNYHNAVELEVDGQKIRIAAEDMEVGERRVYRCEALTDKVKIEMEGSAREDNAYRGAIECYRSAEGMVLINELPLEEYLYAVVPSEMPASYPTESLKAQAVCARTYAYLYILHAGLPEVGAHVDDTTSYQVYHNIRENTATTTAVKETDGILLTYQGEPAQNYYYSTSCGVGTDARIWSGSGDKDLSYMQALFLRGQGNAIANTAEDNNRNISGDHSGMALADNDSGMNLSDGRFVVDSPDNLCNEEAFRRFITSVNEKDLEHEEAWYRWTYTVEEIDADIMRSRIQERYAASPESVLTKTQGEYFVSQPIGKFGKIKELGITQRGAGGVAQELLIVTDTDTYKILAEYNIRCVLCDRSSEVVRQDGSVTVPASLLPSGFFVIDAGNRGESMVGYTLIGGGYGHGVGMSQNGAKALGQEGASYRDILGFFFPGCDLENLGEENDL